MSLFQKLGSKKFSRLPLLPLFFVVVLFKVASSNAYFSDAEFWVTNLSAQGFSVWQSNPSLIFKPLFHAILMIPQLFTKQPEMYLEINRVLFFLVSLATVFLVYRVSRKLLNSEFWALLSAFILLFNTTYFTYSLQVRSDNLAILFHMIALWCFIDIQGRGKSLQIASGFWILALLSTPKAILLILSASPFVLTSINDIKRLLNIKLLLGLFGFIAVSAIVVVSVEAYQNAAMYFFRGFLGKANASVEYMSFRSFVYLKRSISENWFFYLIFILGLLWPFYISFKPPKKNLFEKALYIHSIILLAIFLLIPDKLPFYLSSLMPVFALQVGVTLRDLSQIELRVAKLVVSAMAIIALSAQSYGFYLRYQHTRLVNKNIQQREFITEFSKYLEDNSETTFFDGMGIIPNSQQYFQYIGYGQDELNKVVLKEVLQAKPNLILRTGRMIWVKNQLYKGTSADYIELDRGFFVKGQRFKTKKEFTPILNNYDKPFAWLCINYKDRALLDQIIKGNKLKGIKIHSDKCVGPITKNTFKTIKLYLFDGYYLFVDTDLNLPVPNLDMATLFGLEIL